MRSQLCGEDSQTQCCGIIIPGSSDTSGQTDGNRLEPYLSCLPCSILFKRRDFPEGACCSELLCCFPVRLPLLPPIKNAEDLDCRPCSPPSPCSVAPDEAPSSALRQDNPIFLCCCISLIANFARTSICNGCIHKRFRSATFPERRVSSFFKRAVPKFGKA